MKFIKSFIWVLLCFANTKALFAQQKKSDILIEFAHKNKSATAPDVRYYKVNAVGPAEVFEIKAEAGKNGLLYKFPSEEPLFIKFGDLGYFLAEPGDRITLRADESKLFASGKGVAKYQLMDSIKRVKETVKKPTNQNRAGSKSLADFLEWHDYLSKQLELTVPLIDSYRTKMSKFAFEYVRSTTVDRSLDDYSDKYIGYGKHLGLSSQQASYYFDTKFKPLMDRYFPYVAEHWGGTWKPVLWSVIRAENFIIDTSPEAKYKRRLAYLKAGKAVFKGRARGKFFDEVLYKELVKDFGFLPEIEVEIEKYYAEPGDPDWKAYVRSKVNALRERLNAQSAPDFELIDEKGKIITKQNFKGKLVIFDYWFTGCTGCIQMAPAMKKMEEEFKADTNVVFVNVSIDLSRNQWLKSISDAKYTSGRGLNVYTGGKGDKHPIVKYYNISGYPSLMIMDIYGRTVNVFPKLDPRGEAGYLRMRDFIRKKLVEFRDGPYLFRQNHHLMRYTFDGLVMRLDTQGKSDISQVKVNTHVLGEHMVIKLKDKMVNEPAIFDRPEKLLVLSDIEGNFEAFTKLLIANKVMDKSYNWTFGKGHLVFAGDMFDRGEQVTECLWLMYSLEEKAKAAAGYVHFVLGNHEIMNLQGDDRYAQPKYLANAQNAGKKLSELYCENTELGHWLRTKNIVEKIGDLLFAHGGIGLEFTNVVKLPVGVINELARPNYANKKIKSSSDPNVNMIFDTTRGPLWYRFYYEDSDKKNYVGVDDTTRKFTVYKPTQSHLESILSNYGAKRIITGHTIVADTISTHYNNRVINTDVPHAKGKSEALLIEGNTFYRVNDKGERKLLFRDEEEDIKTKK